MSDGLKAGLMGKEEGKGDLEDQFVQDHSRATYVPNLDFEMNQKTLTSHDIKPADLRAKVEDYLESGGLTRDQLKLLLKQGAEDNHLFMLREETYDKLANVLGMKLDHDEDQGISNISGLLATARLEYNQDVSKSPNIRNLDSTASRFAQMMKSRQILRDKSVAGGFGMGKSNLGAQKKNLAETHQSINPDVAEEEDSMVKGQSEKDHINYNPNRSVAQEHEANLMERVPKMTNQGLKNWLIVGGITFLSLCCFGLWAAVTFITRQEVVQDIIGYYLLVSRGCALAIMVLSIILLLLVSYDFMTCIRPIFAGCCLSILDFNIHFHKICGYLITFYSTVHTISHLSFSVPALSDSDPVMIARVAKYIDNWPWRGESVSYFTVATQTVPGVTGVILELVILGMYFTAFECVRRKCFQVFAYTHVICFPLFFLGMIAHGAGRHINWGFPTAIPFVMPPFLVYCFMIFMRLVNMCRRPFYVADVSIVSTKNFMHLSLVVPKGYTWKSGQYAFINIPAVQAIQWHPFSIASSPNGQYLCFMIKRAGDWTGRLLDLFYEIKEQSFKDSIETMVDGKFDKEFREYLMQMNTEITDEIVQRNRVIFPKCYISKAVSAPAEMAQRRRRIILIGAGSGIAPFLALLDDQQVAAEGGRMRDGQLAKSYIEEYRSTEKAHLILTSRDADQFSWLSPFIDKIMKSDMNTDKVELHLYLTSTKCNTLPSFLFWRAFLLREQKKKQGLAQSVNPIIGSNMHLNVGRPNFEKIIADIHKRQPGDFFVYACAPDIIVNQAMAACNKISEEGKDTFMLRYEIF